MNKIHLTICLLTILVVKINAQETLIYSLQEAIDYALANNRAAKNAARDIEAAKQQKWETTATGLPQIDANIDYQNFLKQQISLIPAEFVGGNPGEFAQVIFGTKQNMNASATLRQLLFDGSYLVGLQSAKVFLEISENAKAKTDLEVRKAVINAYGNVLLAEETIKILINNKAVLDKNLFETQKLFENGFEEEESVEQLQITLSGIESALNNAERLQIIAQQLFNLTIGIDIKTPVRLTDTLDNLAEKNITIELIEADENINNNIDYKIAFNDKVSKDLLLKLERSKSLPSLSSFINAGYLSFSNSFTFLDRDQNWAGFALVGVNLSVPIFSSFGRSAASQRAKINVEKAKEDLIEIEQQLKLETATAKSNYKFSIEDFQIKQRNLDLAERIERKNEIKFFEGIATSFELRQAQTQLYSAQQEYLQAMLEVITKKADLETVLNIIN